MKDKSAGDSTLLLSTPQVTFQANDPSDVLSSIGVVSVVNSGASAAGGSTRRSPSSSTLPPTAVVPLWGINHDGGVAVVGGDQPWEGAGSGPRNTSGRCGIVAYAASERRPQHAFPASAHPKYGPGPDGGVGLRPDSAAFVVPLVAAGAGAEGSCRTGLAGVCLLCVCIVVFSVTLAVVLSW